MSDRDRIGVGYRQAHTFYLDLNLDLLYGCQRNCEGCFVNKTGQSALTVLDHQRLVNLITSAEMKRYYPLIATIGPTDLFSASNAFDVLSDYKTYDVVSRFEKVSFSSTFLAYDANVERIIDLLKEQYYHRDIEINITFEMRHMHNMGYLEHVKQVREKVFERLDNPDWSSFAIFNVFDYSQTKISDVLYNYASLDRLMMKLYGTDADFNFSVGRKEDLTTEEFLQAAEQVKRIFNNNINEQTANKIRFSLGRLTDSLVEKQYNFRGGKLYYSPMFYERYVSFDDHFLLPMEKWVIDEIEHYEEKLTLAQYLGAEHKECKSCKYLGSCVDRGVLMLMDQHGQKSCIVAKDAMNMVNNEPN